MSSHLYRSYLCTACCPILPRQRPCDIRDHHYSPFPLVESAPDELTTMTQQMNKLTSVWPPMSQQPSWTVPSSLLLTLLPLSILISLFMQSRKSNRASSARQTAASKPRSTISIDKTQIILAKISHHRVSPIFHGFLYSSLSVGVPVRSPKSNWLLSIDDEAMSWWDKGWLRVFARGHLHRGRDGSTLSANLDGYLKEQASFPTPEPIRIPVHGFMKSQLTGDHSLMLRVWIPRIIPMSTSSLLPTSSVTGSAQHPSGTCTHPRSS